MWRKQANKKKELNQTKRREERESKRALFPHPALLYPCLSVFSSICLLPSFLVCTCPDGRTYEEANESQRKDEGARPSVPTGGRTGLKCNQGHWQGIDVELGGLFHLSLSIIHRRARQRRKERAGAACIKMGWRAAQRTIKKWTAF